MKRFEVQSIQWCMCKVRRCQITHLHEISTLNQHIICICSICRAICSLFFVCIDTNNRSVFSFAKYTILIGSHCCRCYYCINDALFLRFVVYFFLDVFLYLLLILLLLRSSFLARYKPKLHWNTWQYKNMFHKAKWSNPKFSFNANFL